MKTLCLKNLRRTGLWALLFALAPFPAMAAIDSGDTAWMLTSSALVLIMTPGLAFFYAGLVRSKNAVSTLLQNVVALAVIGVVWVVAGFSLAFKGDGGFIGDTSALFLKGVGQEPDGTSTIPYLLFMAFQMMFAIITPALMTGAFAERVNFKAWLAVLILWSLVVYSPVAHWLWDADGWLAKKGALDFAGGFVVHMTAGYSALVAAILFGKRVDFGTPARPYDVGMVVLGTSLLWFGWFGFNAGSALTSGGLASSAFVTTFLGAAVAMLAWMVVDNLKDGKPTAVGGCVGVVAGLVAITPAAGFVDTNAAMVIGLLAGVICNLVARIVKAKYKLDDTLDVFACHGIGGTIGVISTGLFASKAVNPAGADGLMHGSNALFQANLVGVPAVAIYSMVATFVIIKIVNALSPVRVSATDEKTGLDQTQHGETVTQV
jgi:Amt family ammonium transporter